MGCYCNLFIHYQWFKISMVWDEPIDLRRFSWVVVIKKPARSGRKKVQTILSTATPYCFHL